MIIDFSKNLPTNILPKASLRLALMIFLLQVLFVSSHPLFAVGGTNLVAPILSSPSNGVTLQVLGTNLSWKPVAGATHYKLNIATDPQMTNIVFTDNNVMGTAQWAHNLAYNTTYYWNVRAADISTESPPSSTWNLRTMPDNPAAVDTHPRLLFTASDLPRLQGWANPGNPVYVAMKDALNTAIVNYDTKFFPGGQPNPAWPDNGGITWSGYVTESYAEFFAFWSLIDPNPDNRIQHAKRARNLLMYVIDQAALGTSTGVPFRDPKFMTYDRSRAYGEACPLTVDWIYDAVDENNLPILSAADKAKIQTVFLRWCNDQLTAYNHPDPIGLINDKQLLTSRWALNNYYSGHVRNMTFMSLSMDAADDPVTDPSLHFSALGNSLRSYLYNATGAWLYLQYAMYEKPEIVAADYGVPVDYPSLGLGSGGLPVEGSLYGESIGYVVQELLALKTAGWANENIIGKQSKLLGSDYWTRFMDGLLHSITPEAKIFPQAAYYGPIYQTACYGDLLRTWIAPEMIEATGPLGVLEMTQNNHPGLLDKALWYSRNVIQGGAGYLAQRVSSVWPNSTASYPIYYYMLLDPQNSNPPDPRPKLPITFWDPAFKRILAHSDWTPSATFFDWHCHWTSINHQSGDGNQFELFRKGEWLTKERSGYANDGAGYTSEFHNTLALQNDVPANLQFFETETSARGGQWTNGVNAGDPEVITDLGTDFIYATGDATHLYNRPNQWTPADNVVDIEYAVRSIVWLKPDHVIVYDRAKSKTADRFKRFFLQFTAPPVISGKNATVTTPNGQKLYLSNLLPAAAVLTATVSENFNAVGQLDPTHDQIKIEDPSNPVDIRFLNVLQGADGNVSADPVALLQSSSGTEFDGAVVQNIAVLFPSLWNAGFTSTTYTVPMTVTEQIVTGMTPGAGYAVLSENVPGGVQITITPGGSLPADAGGVLIIHPTSGTNETVHSGPTNALELYQNRPNPFNGNTVISYKLPETATVTLRIFDLLGKQIKTLVENETQGAGYHELVFREGDLAAGVYFYELRAGDVLARRQMVVGQ